MVNRAIHDARQATLIEALRAARKRMRLSQTALAEILGKRQQFVSKYESGERRLDFFEVMDIATALNISATSLVEALSDGGADS